MAAETHLSPTCTTRPDRAWRGEISREELDAKVLGRLADLNAALARKGIGCREIRYRETRLTTWLRHHFANAPSRYEERLDLLTPEQQVRNVRDALYAAAWRTPYLGQLDDCRQIASQLGDLIRSYLAGTLEPLPCDDHPF